MVPLLLDLPFELLLQCLHGVFAILYPSHNAAIRQLKHQLAVALCSFLASVIALIVAAYLHSGMGILIASLAALLICIIVGWLATRLDKEVLAHQKLSHTPPDPFRAP